MFRARSINGKWPTKAEVQAMIVGMKKEAGTEWLADIPAHALLKLADDIMAAFKNWFDSISGKRKGRKMGRPQFRGKFARQFSVYMVNQNTAFVEGGVKLPKLGKVRMRAGDLPQGRLLSSRVYREADKWFMSSVFECQPAVPSVPTVARVGIDMGLTTLATVFDGTRTVEFHSPKALRVHEARLRRYQRLVSRRVKGSHRRERAKRHVAKLHQRIANIRKDAAHKATSAIVAAAGAIVIEDLNVKGMAANRNIAKSVHDSAMSEFLLQLRYKAAWQGREIITASRWFASSKTCSDCGEKNLSVVLGVGRWACPACGSIHERDTNAARNLFAYREELGNAGEMTPKTRMEIGEQGMAARPRPVPISELRISKRHGASTLC